MHAFFVWLKDLHLVANQDGLSELWYGGKYTEADTIQAWDNMLSRYGDRWNVFAIE